MLVIYTFLVFVLMHRALASVQKIEINLSGNPNNKEVEHYKEFDNLSHLLFKPKKGFSFSSVMDGKQLVWKSSHEYEMSRVVVLTYSDSEPALLFVYTEFNSFKGLFFVRKEKEWVETSFDNYTKELNSLKTQKVSKPFVLQLSTGASNGKFFFDYAKDDVKFDTFVPFVGFQATGAYYGVRNLWSASAPGERVVVAWAYKQDGLHYLVRLLVANADNKFRFFNFVRVNKNWVDAESGPFGFLSADDTKFPGEFYFPQYLLGVPNRNAFPASTKYLTTMEDFLDSSFRFKPESKREDYDFKFHNAPIPNRSCSKLDFSKRVPGSVARNVKSVLDKTLPVETYFPNSGTYFSKVSDGSRVLFERNLDSEACVGVHFYRKDKKLFLADVLVSSPHNPRSEYHVKEGQKWTSVTKARFLELMDGLKA